MDIVDDELSDVAVMLTLNAVYFGSNQPSRISTRVSSSIGCQMAARQSSNFERILAP